MVVVISHVVLVVNSTISSCDVDVSDLIDIKVDDEVKVLISVDIWDTMLDVVDVEVTSSLIVEVDERTRVEEFKLVTVEETVSVELNVEVIKLESVEVKYDVCVVV